MFVFKVSGKVYKSVLFSTFVNKTDGVGLILSDEAIFVPDAYYLPRKFFEDKEDDYEEKFSLWLDSINGNEDIFIYTNSTWEENKNIVEFFEKFYHKRFHKAIIFGKEE